MSTQGPKLPTAATGTTGAGTINWITPTNIELADGSDATATFSLAANFTPSKDLIGTGFGFTVPATATVNGIQLQVSQDSTAGTINDQSVRLLKAGTPSGSDKAAFTWPSPGPATASYGGAADLWGTTWTPSDINNANFGALVNVTGGDGASFDVAGCDFFKITVTYTTPAPTVTSVSPTPGSTAGGVAVTITGTNFFSGSISVTFGGSAATSVVFVNSTTITCVTPAHAAGAVNVVVTNPDAQTGTGTNVYTYGASTNLGRMFAMF